MLSFTGESRTPFLHLFRGEYSPIYSPFFPLEEIFMTTFFRHYKNRYYQIVGEALDTRDDTLVIVYRTLYPSEYSLFTRPKEEFFGSVRCSDGSECLRFTPVEYTELPEDARSRVVHEVEIWK